MRIIFRLSVGIICIGLIYDLHAETNFCGSPTPEVTLTIDGLAKNTLKINIPVVMHVIFASNGEGNVHDWQLQAQIDTINSAFSKNGTNYSFFLAGVSRTENDEWWVTSRQTLDEIEMKNALSIDPAHVLNIYIAALSGYNGWATYPWEEPENSKYQGIVIDYKSLPGGVLQNHDKGGIAVHEIGHYLGLYHTYLRGCLYPGDEIDDTPYHLENTGCPGPNTDTCPEKPGLDPVHNYLNATSDDCMHEFTADQSDRMDAMVATYKPNLGGTSINVTNDLNIPISRKWYFRNITLKFANNIKISVDGKFELDNVTLTSNGTSWGGIRFNSGSGGEIYNCNLYKCG